MAAIQGPFTEKKRNGGKKIRPSSQWSGDFGPNSWEVVSLTLFILGRDYENEYVPKLPNYSWIYVVGEGDLVEITDRKHSFRN